MEEGEFPSPCKNCSYYERHHGGEYLGKREAVRASLPVLAGAGVDLDMATAIPNTLAKSLTGPRLASPQESSAALTLQ